jgi:hypothetical protein
MTKKTVKRVLRWGIPLLIYGLVMWVLPCVLNPDNGWKVVIFFHAVTGVVAGLYGLIRLYVWSLSKEEWE